jgi:hypothetical protein
MKRMARLLAFVSLVTVVLSGCASMNTASRVVPLKPADANGPEWSISAKSVGGAVSNDLFFYINGKEVAQGSLSMTKPRNIFSWVYENKTIEAECEFQDKGGLVLVHNCNIYLDKKLVTQLQF